MAIHRGSEKKVDVAISLMDDVTSSVGEEWEPQKKVERRSLDDMNLKNARKVVNAKAKVGHETQRL